MDGLECALRAYKVGWFRYYFLMYLGCCCPERRAAMRKKHFFKKWPELSIACDPDNIKWFNLGTSARERRVRATIVWIVAFFLVILSLIGIIIMKNKTIELKAEFNNSYNCEIQQEDDDSMDAYKSLALADQMLGVKERLGLMHCYCQDFQKKSGTVDMLKVEFSIVNDKGKEVIKKYC